jgi:PAS domain S-box-containing protein
MKVLVVDDNIDNIDMMQILLKSKNFYVKTANNGQEALEKLRSGTYDLIISDILMPVMDGFQFCRECKKDAKLAKISFIFYTATYIDNKDEEFGLSLGAQKFIRKPQEPEVFLNLIKDVIEKSGNKKIASVKYEGPDEKEVLKLYNERLVAKLEKKNLDLEKEIILNKITENRLKESEEGFRNLFQNNLSVMLLIDPDTGQIVDANQSAENFHGWTHQQLTGMRIQDINTFNEGAIAELEKARSQKQVHFEFQHRLANGSVRNVEVYSSKINIQGKEFLHSIIHDITERKRAEEALQEKERMLSSIFNTVGDIIFHLAVEAEGSYRFISINQAFCNITGLREEMIVGKLVTEVIPEPSLSMVLGKYRQAIEGNSIVRWEEISDYPTGRLIADVSIAPVVDNKGRCTHLVGSVHDITERKRAEEIIMKERSLLRTLIDNLPNGVFVKDKEYRKIIVNPIHKKDVLSHLKYLGMDAEIDILGKTDFDVFPQEQAQKFISDDQKIVRDGSVILNKEGLGYYEDGKQQWLLVSKIPLRDKEGEIIGMVGVTTDITERKGAETALRESEERFRYVFEHSTIGKSLTAPDGRLLRINSAFADMLGYSMEEMHQLNFKNITHPDDLTESMDCMRCLLANERDKYRMEKRYFHKSGKIIWADVSTTLFRSGSDIAMYFITNIIDITEKKEQEQQLIIAKEKAEESDKLKTAFLHNISHEIRTPMNAIVGFSDLLHDPELEYERRMHYTDIICQSSNQLLSIITDIVNISTIEAGHMKIIEKEVNLNRLLNDLFQQHETIANKRGIELFVSTGLSDNESGIIIDETKFLEILSNLINNALKFTKQGYVRFGYLQKMNKIEFYVEDTGIGIPEDVQKKIFERFHQADSTISREYGGTGLGLSISQSYVNLLGGEIWLKSEPGKGSVFFFNIPYNKIEKVEIEEKKIIKETPLKFNQSKTILVAEDEENNYLLIENYLYESDIHLLWARDGIEAIEMYNDNKTIDLVLMDIKMPREDGYVAARKIKSINPVIPVIAITAYTQEEDMGKAFIAGCTDYLPKPVKREELVSMIVKYLKE